MYSLRYFDNIWLDYMSCQDVLSHARIFALLCLLFELSSLKNFKGQCRLPKNISRLARKWYRGIFIILHKSNA